MMSPYSKKIYAIMMRELNIMGPYQIDRVCKRVGMDPYKVRERDLPYLTKELTNVVLGHGGRERAKKVSLEFRALHDLDAMVKGEKDPYRKFSYIHDGAATHRATGDNDNAIAEYEKMIELARKEQRPVAESFAHRHLGDLYIDVASYDVAKAELEEALKLAEASDNQEQVAKCHLMMSKLNWRTGNLGQALRDLDGAESIASLRRDEVLLGKVIIRRGTILFDLGRTKESLYVYASAIEILKRLGDKADLSRAYNNQGLILIWEGRLDDALNVLEKSLEAADEASYQRGLAYACLNMAECHARMGDSEAACKEAARSRDIFTKMNERVMLARLNVVDAMAACVGGRHDEATPLLEDGLATLEELNTPADLAWAHNVAGCMHQRLGMSGAEEHFSKAENIFREMGNDTLADIVARKTKC